MASIQVQAASAAITVNGTAAGYVGVTDATPFKPGAMGNIAQAGVLASGTVTFATPLAGDDITVGATTFIATAGAVVLGTATYSIDTSNDAAAASLAAQILGHAVASLVVSATALGPVTTVRALTVGTAGNAIVLTSADGITTAVSGAGTLTGGVATANLTIQIVDIVANTIGIRILPDPPAIGNRVWDQPLRGPTYGRSSATAVLVASNCTVYQLEQIVAQPRNAL